MENRDRGALKAQVQRRYELRAPYLTEQLGWAWAAAEALTVGRGGKAIVAEAIGISRTTLTKAKHEGLSPSAVPSRQRRLGGGRKFLVATDAGLLDALEALIDPRTRGDPESPLRGTCKSTYQLAAALSEQGHPISQRTVYRLLEALGYSLQANRKTQEGAEHPDRDAQFLFLYRHVQRFRRKKLPMISVDTKKKENLGNVAQKGREGEPQGRPTKVQT
jgi:DNA-binding phage protein